MSNLHQGEAMRLKVYEASAYSEINFLPGEYEGPFVINRPMRLIGQGRQPAAVTLWARYAPVIIVRSPNVALMNVRVETTYTAAPPVWYEAGCQPDCRRAEMNYQEVDMAVAQQTGGWQLPSLIDLGELPPQQMVKLPLTLTVPAPAKLSENLAGLQIYPTQLPQAGQHAVQLTLAADKLIRDTLLVGQLMLQTAHETRAVWVVGRVTEQSQWAYPHLWLVSQTGRKVVFGTKTVLGPAQLVGEAGAARLSALQAYIQQEINGSWTIIQPEPVTVPTRIQGQLLEMGQRRGLKSGEQVELGPIKLTVATQTIDLPLTVASELDLGKLSQAQTVTLTIQNNRQVTPWLGTLHATVDWLTIANPQIICLGGQTLHVPVTLSPSAKNLPPQSLHQLGALVLAGGHESWLINVRLEVDDLAPKLTLDPPCLDWGEVMAWAQTPAQTIRLRNDGATPWTGQVMSHVPWLEARPGQLTCPPHGEVFAPIYLTAALETLPPGPLEVTKALTLVDGTRSPLEVTARLTLALPQLEAIPPRLELTIYDKTAMPRTLLRLRNLSHRAWAGTVRSTLPWLEVAPLQLHCLPHQETVLQVWLNDQAQPILSQPTLHVPDALKITGQGAVLMVGCSLTTAFKPTRPGGEATDQVLDFGQVLLDPATWPRREIRVTNPRPWSVEGRAQSMVPWLEVTPAQFTHASKQELIFEVRLTPEALKLKETRYDVPQAVVIQSGDHRQAVRVQVTVKIPTQTPLPRTSSQSWPNTNAPLWAVRPPRKPSNEYTTESLQLVVKPLRLEFGTVKRGRGSIPLASQELHVSHEAVTQSLNLRLQSMVPWLTVTPTQASCAPRQTIWVTVQLTAAARELTPRVYDVADAVLIESGSQKVLVGARVEVVR